MRDNTPNCNSGHETASSCDMADAGNCDGPADRRVEWGMFSAYRAGRPHQTATLCHAHTHELWEQCKGPVTVGLMYYVTGEIV